MDIEASTVLVTGGAGMIGSSTIDLLLRQHPGVRVVILDNLSRGNLANVGHALKNPHVRFIRGDICDRSAVEAAMKGVDAVIHLAALRITACAADPRRAMDVMCNGTFNVVDAARLACVKRMIAASSASIYGLAESFPTREDHHPYNDRTWYGASKTMLEGLLRSYYTMFGLPYLAMRYFNVYGPRMDIHGKYTEVLIRWIERVAEGESPLILGDGSQTMDFVYIDDVARANVLALESDVVDEAFNIASGTETSLRDLADALLGVMDASELLPEFGPERSVNPVPRRLASIEKARRLLGFTATVDLNAGLRRLVDWWRANQQVAVRA